MELMIDLETLGLKPKSVITQIGWCLFDFSVNDFKSRCFFPDPDHQMKLGRSVDWSTFKWWMEQEPEAREKMCSEITSKGVDSISPFMQFFNWNNIDHVWANGPNFDLTMLEDLLGDYAYKAPWKYNAPRDFRTIMDLAPKDPSIINPVKHDAEQDALWQAKQVWQAWRKIKNMPPIKQNEDEIPF